MPETIASNCTQVLRKSKGRNQVLVGSRVAFNYVQQHNNNNSWHTSKNNNSNNSSNSNAEQMRKGEREMPIEREKER